MIVNGTNIFMTRGDSETLTVSIEDEKGNPRPFVEGDTVYFTVKLSTNETNKLLQKIVTTFRDGDAIVKILPEDTKNIKFGNYVYDVQINLADGTVKTIILPSEFKIGGEVTHD